MKTRVDMHVHSTFSDGLLKPNEIINYMRLRGVNIVSITDHNSINAYFENLDIQNITLITGVEIDINHNNDIQFLCYGFDINSKRIKTCLDEIQKSRLKACIKLISKIRKMGIDIELNNALYSNINDFDYICEFLVKKKLSASTSEIKTKYFGREGELHYEIPRIKIQDCIDMIKEAGGFVVLAHPGRISKDLYMLESLIKRLVDCGLAGVECFHPDHSSEFTDKLIKIANKYKLKITGGSDMHLRSTEFKVLKKDLVL